MECSHWIGFAVAAIIALSVVGPSTSVTARSSTTAEVAGPSASFSPVKDYLLPVAGAYPLGITTDGAGNVWFAEDNSDAIVELTPSNSTFHSYLIPTNHHLAWIWFLVFAEGRLWFSDESQPMIWSFSLATHAFSNFSANGAYPFSLSYDQARSRMWFTSLRTQQVGFFVLAGGGAKIAPLINLTAPTHGAVPSGIVTDERGDAFVSETFQAKIVEIDAISLSIVRAWQLPAGSEPVGLSFDAAHERLWFTNHASSFFGYVELGGTGYEEFSTSPLFQNGTFWVTLPYWIDVSSDGAVWFDEHSAGRIARFDPGTRQLTEFVIPSNSSAPLRLFLDDAKGLVWFSEFSGNAIGEVQENASLAQSVRVSVPSITLDPTGVFNASPLPPAGASPTLSMTGTATGVPGPGFSATSIRFGGGYLVTVTLGNAAPGNYTAATCFDYSSSIKCGYVNLIIPSPPSTELVLASVGAALGAILLVLALALHRESARKSAARNTSPPRPPG